MIVENVDRRVSQAYLEHAGPLYRFAFRLLGDGDEARDVIQESFLRLHRVTSGGRPPDNAKAWIFRTAGNLCLDHLRRCKSARKILDHSEAPSSDFEAEWVREEEIRQVRLALGRMRERDRLLLMLYQDGFSYREMAEILLIHPPSLGKTLARALQRLAAELENGRKP